MSDEDSNSEVSTSGLCGLGGAILDAEAVKKRPSKEYNVNM